MNVRSARRGAPADTVKTTRYPAAAARPRLYVAAAAASDPLPLRSTLAEIVSAADIAAVLLRLDDADERSLINAVKALAPVVQAAGTAVLVADRPDLVARGGADGAHLCGLPAVTAALPSLKPTFIAGVGGVASRHDAMIAAEAGADYVMFGDPDAHGRSGALDAVIEQVAWWAEMVEVPCVGYAPDLDAVAALAAAGADFVAVGAALFDDPRGPGAAAADAATRLGARRDRQAEAETK